MFSLRLVLISLVLPVSAFAAEEASLQAETVRLEGENKAMEKTVSDLRVKVDKASGEVEALRALRQEKAQHFLDLSAERDRLTAALKKLEQERAEEKAEFERVKAQESAVAEDVKKAEQALAVRQAELDAERPAAAAATEPPTRLPSASASAVEPALGEEPSAPAMTFTKKCRIFEAPARGSNVLGLKEPGVSVGKTAEGPDWIAFMESGRKGYVSKNCFR